MKNLISWKFMDEAEKFQDNIQKVLSSMKQFWFEDIKKTFHQDSKHFVVAGGNYTYFFVLSKTIPLLRKKYPFLPISLKMIELRKGSKELYDENSFDVLLSSRYLDFDSGFFDDIANTPFALSRKSYDDEVYLCASDESVQRFGSVKETLQKHDVLFGRVFSNNQLTNQLSYLYRTTPLGRENVVPRVATDQIFLSYLLMQNSIGITIAFKSFSAKQPGVVILGEKIVTIRRLFLYKKEYDAPSRYVARKIMKMLYKDMKNNDVL